MYPPGPQTPRPACCLGLARVLAHREQIWRTPQEAGSRQHSGPFSGGGPGKTTPKEAPGPSSQPRGNPRAVSSWRRVIHTGLPREPHSMAPPGAHASAPALMSRPPQAAVVARPTADPQKPEAPVGSTFRCVHSLHLPAHHPEPVCKRVWTPLGAEVQGGTHRASFLGAGHAPDLRASAGLCGAAA